MVDQNSGKKGHSNTSSSATKTVRRAYLGRYLYQSKHYESLRVEAHGPMLSALEFLLIHLFNLIL